MAAPTTIDEIVAAIKELDEEDRDYLLLQLAQMDEFTEALESFLAKSRAEHRNV